MTRCNSPLKSGKSKGQGLSGCMCKQQKRGPHDLAVLTEWDRCLIWFRSVEGDLRIFYESVQRQATVQLSLFTKVCHARTTRVEVLGWGAQKKGYLCIAT